MGRTDVGDILPGLCPGSGVGGMGVNHTAYFRKRTVEGEMGGSVGRGTEVALHYLAGIEVDNHHIVDFHSVVVNAARFDYHETLLAVYTGDVAPGKYNESVFDKVKIRTENFFFQFFKHDSFRF